MKHARSSVPRYLCYREARCDLLPSRKRVTPTPPTRVPPPQPKPKQWETTSPLGHIHDTACSNPRSLRTHKIWGVPARWITQARWASPTCPCTDTKYSGRPPRYRPCSCADEIRSPKGHEIGTVVGATNSLAQLNHARRRRRKLRAMFPPLASLT